MHLYSTFSSFAWVGFRRGLFRELSVLVVSVGGFFLLQSKPGPGPGNHQTSVGNRLWCRHCGRKVPGLAARRQRRRKWTGAGLHPRPLRMALRCRPADRLLSRLVGRCCSLTYLLTNKAIPDSLSSSGLLAAILGVGNGLFYIPTFAPRLMAFIPEVGVTSVSSPGTGVAGPSCKARPT